MRRTSRLAVALVWLCAAGGVARADAEAEQLLDRMDRAVQGAANKVWICRMRSIGTDGNVREGRFLMLQNSGDKRLLRFLSPADMRNTAMLTMGKGELYVYLPADRRVRRLGTSALHQTFLGADFYAEDLGAVRLKDEYDAKIVARAGNEDQPRADAQARLTVVARHRRRGRSRSGAAHGVLRSPPASWRAPGSAPSSGRSRATRRGCRRAC